MWGYQYGVWTTNDMIMTWEEDLFRFAYSFADSDGVGLWPSCCPKRKENTRNTVSIQGSTPSILSQLIVDGFLEIMAAGPLGKPIFKKSGLK